MNDFRDLVSVVTGGCSGIGAATASLMTQRGAKVAILDRDIRQPSERWALGLQCDVGDSSSVSSRRATHGVSAVPGVAAGSACVVIRAIACLMVNCSSNRS